MVIYIRLYWVAARGYFQMAAETLLEKQAEAKQGFLAASCLLLFCYNASLGLDLC